MLLLIITLFRFCLLKENSDGSVPYAGLGRCQSWLRFRFLVLLNSIALTLRGHFG